MYKEGFLVGLPLADFQWALLWNSQSPPKRRIGFPTWSWAGWRVGIWPTYPLDLTKPHQYPIHLFIWKALEGQLVLIFGAPQGNYKDAEELRIILKMTQSLEQHNAFHKSHSLRLVDILVLAERSISSWKSSYYTSHWTSADLSTG